MVTVNEIKLQDNMKPVSLERYDFYRTVYVPDWVTTIAIDNNGLLYGFCTDQIIPDETYEEWDYPPDYDFGDFRGSRYYHKIGTVKFNGDWKESKVVL
jgi:hypothetical protein